MTWFRSDDDLPEHPKSDVLEQVCPAWADLAAAWMTWHHLGCDCARRRTDGVFTRSRAHRAVRLPPAVVDAALEHYDVGISRPKIRVGESEETYRERYIAIGKERHTAVAELLEQPWFKEKTPDKQKEDIEDKLTAALRKVNDKFKVEKPAEP